MMILLSLFFAFAAILEAASISSTPFGAISEYVKLYKLCEDASSQTCVAARYGDDYYKTFEYGACFSTEVEGKRLQTSVFCKSATCYDNPNLNCTGGAALPVPVPVLEYTYFANLADVTELLDHGAICQPNELP